MTVMLKIIDEAPGAHRRCVREMCLVSERVSVREMMRRRIEVEVAEINTGVTASTPLVMPTEWQRRLNGKTLMMPNDAYRCTVPGRGASKKKDATEGIALRFEGDRVLAIVLSKAFLLAADDKITDPTICRQIDTLR